MALLLNLLNLLGRFLARVDGVMFAAIPDWLLLLNVSNFLCGVHLYACGVL